MYYIELQELKFCQICRLYLNGDDDYKTDTLVFYYFSHLVEFFRLQEISLISKFTSMKLVDQDKS